MKRIVDRVLEDVAVILFAFLCTIVFASVMARYVFKHPLMWTMEVIIYSFMWVVFLGAAIVYKKKKHISISVFTSMLPVKTQRILGIVSDLLILVFMILLLVKSYVLARMNNIPSITIPVPVSAMTFSLPVMSVIMIYYALCSLVEQVKDFYK